MNREIVIDFKRIFFALRRSWIPALIAGFVAFTISVVITYIPAPDQYHAQSTVYMVSTEETLQGIDNMTRSTFVLKGYSQVAKSLKVLDKAASFLGDADIASSKLVEMVTVAYEADSNIISISVVSTSGNFSMAAVNAVTEAFVGEIRAITGQNSAQILDMAQTYNLLQSGVFSQWRIRLIAFGLGWILFLAYVAVREILSSRIATTMDVELLEGVELLGVVPDFLECCLSNYKMIQYSQESGDEAALQKMQWRKSRTSDKRKK